MDDASISRDASASSPGTAYIRMLGGYCITFPGGVIEIPRQLPGILFALLALYPDRVWTREEIIAQIWPDTEPEAARAGLRQALYRLRHLLGDTPCRDALRISPLVIQLDASRASIDTLEFQRRLLEATEEPDTDARLRALAAAIALYHGDLLPGFSGALVSAERQQLKSRYQLACHQAAGALQATGDRTLASALTAHAADRRLCAEAPAEFVRRYDSSCPPLPVDRDRLLQGAELSSLPGEEDGSATDSPEIAGSGHVPAALPGDMEPAHRGQALHSGAARKALRLIRPVGLMCLGAAIALVAGARRLNPPDTHEPAHRPLAVNEDGFGIHGPADGLALDAAAGRIFASTRAGSICRDYLHRGRQTTTTITPLECVMAVDSSTGILYMAEPVSGRIRVVRSETGQPIGTFQGPRTGISLLACDAASRRLLVIEHNAARIDEYRSDGSHLLSAGLLVHDPVRIVVSAIQERAYVLGRQDGSIDVVDIATGQTIISLDTDLCPEDMALDETAGRLYVSNSRSGTVDVFDCRTPLRIQTLTVPHSPHGLAIDTAAGVLYVCCQENSTLQAIDTHSLQPIVSMACPNTSPRFAAIDPIHGRLLISSGSEAALMSYRLP